MTEATVRRVDGEQVGDELPSPGTAIVRPVRHVQAVRDRFLPRFAEPTEVAVSRSARAWAWALGERAPLLRSPIARPLFRPAGPTSKPRSQRRMSDGCVATGTTVPMPPRPCCGGLLAMMTACRWSVRTPPARPTSHGSGTESGVCGAVPPSPAAAPPTIASAVTAAPVGLPTGWDAGRSRRGAAPVLSGSELRSPTAWLRPRHHQTPVDTRSRNGPSLSWRCPPAGTLSPYAPHNLFGSFGSSL